MNVRPATVVSLVGYGELKAEPDGGTSCKVREFALLDDGREVTLLDDRGWTSTARIDQMSLDQAVRNVYNVVLPDDAETSGQMHEWERFEHRLRMAGVAATPDQLRALPYRVILALPGSAGGAAAGT